MSKTSMSIRLVSEVKEQAQQVFNSLGMDMTTAINIFLRTTIRENGIPFALKLDIPNAITASAIEEGRKIAYDDTVKKYSNIDDLRKALEI